MSWNGRRNEAELGSAAAAARSGKNGVIQICGLLTPTRRTPKSRLLDTVTQNIGSLFAPKVCANGAQRPHELVRPSAWLATVSWTGGALLSALTTHSDAFGPLYEPLTEGACVLSPLLNKIHWPS